MKLLSIFLMLSCYLGVQFDDNRTTQQSSDVCPHRGFDLLIANMHEELHVPYTLSSTVLEWNNNDSNEIEAILKFSSVFLHDDTNMFFIRARIQK